MYDHTFMVTGSSYHNPHFHVDGLVVFKIPTKLDPHIGTSVAWMQGISVYVLHLRLVGLFPCIHKICEMCCQLIHGHLYLVSQPTPPWEWLRGLQILQNLDLHTWWPVAWMEGIPVYKLHISISQACETLPKSPQEM